MSNHCQVLGKVPTFGRTVSHSGRRTSRRFVPNIQRRRYWVPSLGRHVRLRVSTDGIKVIDRRGIDVVVADLLRRGETV